MSSLLRRMIGRHGKPSTAFAVITLCSLLPLLAVTSPELSWDEAYRFPYAQANWHTLWSSYDVSHGPMSVYLAKLGLDVLPETLGLEFRARLFAALFGAMAVALAYSALRYFFHTSREAAVAGAGLLAFSVIRTSETNVIGPHHLILFCVVLVVALGYRWLESPSIGGGVVIGLVLGFGALSSTYIVPVAAGWVIATAFAGKRRVASLWMIVTATSAALLVVAALWPPGVFRRHFLDDFVFYLRFAGHATLVGDQIVGVTPRWAVAYWLWGLELPASLAFVALLFRRRPTTTAQKYLLVTLAFYLALLLKAHIAGPRNMLQFIGVLCLAVGALFDDVVSATRGRRFASAAVCFVALTNFVVVTSRNQPYLATNGYRSFVRDNRHRIEQPAHAMVYGSPALRVYAEAAKTDVRWNVQEMPWTTGSEWAIPSSVRYVLMPAVVYDHMPPSQPMRRIVAASWNLVWRFESDDAWELRLYERPSR